MDSKTVTGQATPSKLGFTAAAKISAPAMSGCGKQSETSCGIRQKLG